MKELQHVPPLSASHLTQRDQGPGSRHLLYLAPGLRCEEVLVQHQIQHVVLVRLERSLVLLIFGSCGSPEYEGQGGDEEWAAQQSQPVPELAILFEPGPAPTEEEAADDAQQYRQPEDQYEQDPQGPPRERAG